MWAHQQSSHHYCDRRPHPLSSHPMELQQSANMEEEIKLTEHFLKTIYSITVTVKKRLLLFLYLVWFSRPYSSRWKLWINDANSFKSNLLTYVTPNKDMTTKWASKIMYLCTHTHCTSFTPRLLRTLSPSTLYMGGLEMRLDYMYSTHQNMDWWENLLWAPVMFSPASRPLTLAWSWCSTLRRPR